MALNVCVPWEGNRFIALHAWRWIFDIRLSPLGNSVCSCGRICGIGRYRWCGCVRWEKKPILLFVACSFSAWIQSPLRCSFCLGWRDGFPVAFRGVFWHFLPFLLAFWQFVVLGWYVCMGALHCSISGRYLAFFACFQPGFFSLLSVLRTRFRIEWVLAW